MSKAVTAATRFGYGARPGELPEIARNPMSWLLDQLQGPSRPHVELSDLPSSATVLVSVQDLRRARRNQKRDNNNNDNARNYGRTVRQHYVRHCNARYRAAAESDTPFYERLVHFWANHFAVSADKQPLPAIAGLFENEAIRPNIGGKFADLLLAVEKHPAMIFYLDNQRSIGPGSTFAKHANRRRRDREIGLNENLAREILELHTLGVDGGYSQQDVTSLAKTITGWSIGGSNDRGQFSTGVPGTFAFRDNNHEPGSQSVLGTRYAQKGQAQGEAVLKDLANHPSTARFVATKLARHFIADDPPTDVVARLAENFLKTGGDLASLYESLVRSEASWSPGRAKYKTPHDFVISTLRAFGRNPGDPRFIIGALETMGQMPYRPGSPAGWPDTADHWGGADALYKRIEWSNTVSRLLADRVNPVGLGDAILGDTFSPETRKAISRAESLTQGLTLLLASPDFQRR